MSEKIKYICQTEERKFLEKNSREKRRERERDENSERLWPLLVLQKPYPTRGQKKLCLRCSFIFFFKRRDSIKFFF